MNPKPPRRGGPHRESQASSEAHRGAETEEEVIHIGELICGDIGELIGETISEIHGLVVGSEEVRFGVELIEAWSRGGSPT